MSFRFTVAITVLALAILAVFYVGAFLQLDLGQYANPVEPEAGGAVCASASGCAPKRKRGMQMSHPRRI